MKAALSQRLVYLRKERGYTQKQAASMLGISQALLSHYEKGIRECGLEFLCNCAELYDVSTDYLLGLSCEKNYSAYRSQLHEEADENGCRKRSVLIRAMGILFDLYKSLENKELENELALYMSSSIYMMIRYLYEAGNNIPGFFSTSSSCFPHAVISTKLMAEMRIKNILDEEMRSNLRSEEGSEFPKIDHTSLSKMFPTEYTELLKVLHLVDTKCIKDENA